MSQSVLFLIFCLLCMYNTVNGAGMLYPRESESREMKDIDGMWNFRVDRSPTRDQGFTEEWYKRPLSESGPVISMPVPSSFNDITTDKSLREYVGWAWYDRQFFVSPSWQSRRIVLRIDSAHYNSIVWVNAQEVVRHEGGHLPFEADVSSHLSFNMINNVTVAINNTLTFTTIPPGQIQYKTDRTKYPEGYFVQLLPFDFFNYAGIHRHVRIYTTPKTYVDDITISTETAGNTNGLEATIKYDVFVVNPSPSVTYQVDVLNREGSSVASAPSASATLTIGNAQLWWPWTMSKLDFAYMYTLQVVITDNGIMDTYRQPFGIRTIKITNTSFHINGHPFYCQGLGKHEDAEIRGKGLDYPTIARDFHMLKWLNVNCFRTSHYPYAEEIMDQADQQGIVVIDECPGVGMKLAQNFGSVSLNHHKNVMFELIRRDKNRPSVIMWSVANEPSSALIEAEEYFRQVFQHTRQLDSTRPVTFVSNSEYNIDKAAQFTDVLCINRYYSWYSDVGHLEVIKIQLTNNMRNWNNKFGRPVIVSEYGADTIAGMHLEPSFIFTEEFQNDFMTEYFNVFDILRNEFLVGEMIWNFADFMTDQQINRVIGNKKGVLTRQRQPKASGHLLRERYMALGNATVNVLHGCNTCTNTLPNSQQNINHMPHQMNNAYAGVIDDKENIVEQIMKRN